MCSIVGSFDRQMFEDLIKLNETRGSFSHSFTVINPDDHTMSTVKNWGPFGFSLLNGVTPGHYMLGHCQAPTGGMIKDEARIHPYVTNGIRLLHNGIIMPSSMKLINTELNAEYTWDTQAICEYMMISGTIDPNRLNSIEGSFACVVIDDDANIKIFRNAIAPLFYDSNINISSTAFNGSLSTISNMVYKLDIVNSVMHRESLFNNTYNPFLLD
jgi:glucosamine 6-phosphate synthetase-like amidotransferase/phosphosugar isomerase protein